MAMPASRTSTEPIMEAGDKLPAAPPAPQHPDDGARGLPFGLRFAVSPLRSGKHGKTYYTVTVTEPTQVSHNGKVVTRSDQVQRERED